MTLVPTTLDAAAAAHLAALLEEAGQYADRARAANTLRAYRSDWAHFTAWCTEQRLAALPSSPSTLALYLTDLAKTAKPATLERRLSAIAQAHRLAGQPVPN